MRYLKVSEVCLRLNVDDAFLRSLQDEGLIEVKHSTDDEALISAPDAERLRVTVVLMREMDVNLAGVEVVLRMREQLMGMHRQFDAILHDLVDELRKRMDR